MKKTYITPEALTISLVMSSHLALSGYNTIGDGNQLVKGQVIINDEDDSSTTGGLKNIWDEEW